MSLDDPHVSGAASPSPVQVDIVGEGDDFLSDASDMDDPEDRKPRRTRFCLLFHPPCLAPQRFTDHILVLGAPGTLSG